MRLIESIGEMQSWSRKVKLEGKSIGFVPTMGFFHEGHISLMKASKSENDLTVVSIYVNPTQFGPKEDFSKYPRDLERDLEMSENTGVNVVFAPSDKDIYPEGYKTYVNVNDLSDKWEGKSRPGHFKGVCTIVLKLLNITQPDNLYLGQKDAQQCVILSRMIKELNLPVSISIQPTVREPDGVAMSSRNSYLNPDERKAAKVLYASLQLATSLIDLGETNSEKILQEMQDRISQEKLAKLDYVAIVDPINLNPLPQIQAPVIICLAVYIGKTRLIDNLWITEIKPES